MTYFNNGFFFPTACLYLAVTTNQVKQLLDAEKHRRNAATYFEDFSCIHMFPDTEAK